MAESALAAVSVVLGTRGASRQRRWQSSKDRTSGGDTAVTARRLNATLEKP